MARTITTKPATVSSKVADPYQQPCFSVFTQQHSVYGAGWMTYNHNLEYCSNYTGDGSYAYNRFRTYTTSAPEFFQNYASSQYFETQSTPSSNSEACQNTCNVGYLGHQNFHSVGEYSKTAGYVIANSGRQWRGNAFRDCASIVNETHQDYAIFTQHNSTTGTWFTIGQRSASRYYCDTQQYGRNRFNIPAQTSNGQGMYASACYNAKTKKFVVIEQETSNYRFQPVVWNNVPDFRAIATNSSDYYHDEAESYSAMADQQGGSVYDFFQNTANRDLYDRMTGNGMNQYTGQAEAHWRTMSCLCDNGRLVTFSQTPSNGCLVQRWNADGTYEGVLWNGTWTTSYGYEQGSRFGSRWQVSTSGKYWWAYCPSYYYGAGLYWIAVRVSDGKVMYFQTNDSTHGRMTCPIGLNSMVITYDTNADGPGIYHREIELDYFFNINADMYNMPLDNNYNAWTLDTAGNSTDYPLIIPAYYNTSLFNTQLESNL